MARNMDSIHFNFFPAFVITFKMALGLPRKESIPTVTPTPPLVGAAYQEHSAFGGGGNKIISFVPPLLV